MNYYEPFFALLLWWIFIPNPREIYTFLYTVQNVNSTKSGKNSIKITYKSVQIGMEIVRSFFFPFQTSTVLMHHKYYLLLFIIINAFNTV